MSEYHVSKSGSDGATGSAKAPFLTISKAAQTAVSGDRIIVHGGIYREWVKPRNGGRSPFERIIYEAARGEQVIIKGSEQVSEWEHEEGNVWKTLVDNSVFGDYNPYKESLSGDWLLYPDDGSVHLGDVYMNGKSFYEAKALEELKNPVRREMGMNPPWTGEPEPLLHPEDSVYQWFAQVDENTTTIYANFQGRDPNQEFTEINVRKCCFYPEETGKNYITVRGFEFAQAACPWTPPTADQPGMVGTNWSKGWIIEDNVIHDAKCSGVSIGKERSTGHNLCTATHRKPGYQYQMEAVFKGKQLGWNREWIGSHCIRRNEIFDCGQNGIVGHLGCVFSEISDNHIYNIAVKQEFFGYEIAGIKLHAAIDVQIVHNYIHNCTLGTWLDWQAQGTRVSRNLYRKNDRDLMVEVTHGPYMVDNNIFASKYNFDNVAQGGAYIQNLCMGIMRRQPVLDRSTPYHYAHTTDIAGVAFVYSGDDRLYQNIFAGNPKEDEEECGTLGYRGHPVSMKEYTQTVVSLGNEDHEQFNKVRQPVYINENVYINGAKAFEREERKQIIPDYLEVDFREEPEGIYLDLEVPEALGAFRAEPCRTSMLGVPRITETPYENPDGSEIVFEKDYTGKRRTSSDVWAGPLAELKTGRNHFKIW